MGRDKGHVLGAPFLPPDANLGKTLLFLPPSCSPRKDINTVCQACLHVYWTLPMAISGTI